jgi:hypothetical protein
MKSILCIGKIQINKVRLYYFFSKGNKGFLSYLEEDGVNTSLMINIIYRKYG